MIIEWAKYVGDENPVRIDMTSVRSYALWTDIYGYFHILNKRTFDRLKISQRQKDNLYFLYKEDNLISKLSEQMMLNLLVEQIIKGDQ